MSGRDNITQSFLPAVYVLAEYLLLAGCLQIAYRDFFAGHYAHLVFTLTSAAFPAYAICRYIGWQNSVNDVCGT